MAWKIMIINREFDGMEEVIAEYLDKGWEALWETFTPDPRGYEQGTIVMRYWESENSGD